MTALAFARLAGSPRRLPTRKVWGDGFADDGWTELSRVMDWKQCDGDELYRKFPNLHVDPSAPWPAPLRAAFACFLDAEDCERLQRQSRIEGPRSGFCPCRGSDVRNAGADLVAALAQAAIPAAVPPFSDDSAALVAFFTGVHPAYIWPEALLSHDRFATVGWLGHVERHGRALMPLEVAQYVLEVIVHASGGFGLVDPRLSTFLGPDPVPGNLRRAAERRVRAGPTVFARRDHARWWKIGRPQWL